MRLNATDDKSGRWPAWGAAGLIALFILAGFSEARLKSVSNDEPPHLAAGMSYFVSHQIFRANPQHPPLMKELAGLSVMLSGVRWPHTADADYLVNGDDPARVFGLDWQVGKDIIARNGPDRVLAWARAPMILTGALLAAVLFLWGRQLFGAAAGFCAVLVCVLDPVVFAHSQFVTTDVGVAAFSVLALFALWNYLQKRSWARLILAGLALGAALCAKFSAVFLLPIEALLLLAAMRWPVAAPPQQDARRAGDRALHLAVIPFAVLCAAAFFVIEVIYFFPSDLAMYAKCARMVNADHVSIPAFMLGSVSDHFTSYFLVCYLLKEPIAAIILAGLGLGALLRRGSTEPLKTAFVLLPPALYFAAYTAAADPMGVRYIMPVLPFTHLLAGAGLAGLIGRARHSRRALITTAALCGWLALAWIGIYPDHLAYFNEAACAVTEPEKLGLDGGSKCGPELLDFTNVDWGQGMKQLKTWLDRNAPGATPKMIADEAFLQQAYGIRLHLITVDDLLHEPEPGLYVLSAHFIGRAPALDRRADWLRFTRPTAVVGHSLYVYDLRR